ncbi:hypothetical protein [Leptothrix discophora]|uniref:Uncharacterized protein n=1 Tax=Leptothrix discophora TaxID=89 RepID=A0ABT9G0V8_LEPDI|nr:hypothetical protein [Leptothrix discophora]MDP4299942.1 hypothetical protein [Leptothrix discophora]
MKNEDELFQALAQLTLALEEYVQQQARLKKMIHQIELMLKFLKDQ